MRSAAIRQQIEERTKHAFGKHVWPHLFRDCAVTELVDCAPEEIGIAPDLLSHADLQTTKKHYILEWAPRAGQDQAAGLTRARACCSSKITGLR